MALAFACHNKEFRLILRKKFFASIESTPQHTWIALRLDGTKRPDPHGAIFFPTEKAPVQCV